MKLVSWRMLYAAAVCGAGWLGGRDAAAQSFGGAPAAGGISPGASASSLGGPTTAPTAPLGAVNPMMPLGGSTAQGGVFGNPLAATLMYNSMLQSTLPQAQAAQGQAGALYGPTGLGTAQVGMMLLANQQAGGGIGSGRISGTRTDPRSREAANATADPKQRIRTKPGGLASRYFNRTGAHAPYPKNYFNRRPRYFP